MATFRVWGSVLTDFVHSIEADSAEDAERQVSLLRPHFLDSTSCETTDVQGCIELDEDGNEID